MSLLCLGGQREEFPQPSLSLNWIWWFFFFSFFPWKAQDYRHQRPLFPKVASCDIKINVWLQSLKFCRCYLWVMSGIELWKLKTLYATDMVFHVVAVPTSHWSCPSSSKNSFCKSPRFNRQGMSHVGIRLPRDYTLLPSEDSKSSFTLESFQTLST